MIHKSEQWDIRKHFSANMTGLSTFSQRASALGPASRVCPYSNDGSPANPARGTEAQVWIKASL